MLMSDNNSLSFLTSNLALDIDLSLAYREGEERGKENKDC